MQSVPNIDNIAPVRGTKQVKVDNWGTFFLQRLLQLYFNEELLDLKIKFCSTNNVLNVHKIVVSTCTDYFLQPQLQRNQHDGSFEKNVVVMPSDMPYESVKSIISFMYTGQLEYKTSDQNDLYHTAQKMNMTVLTKLLETQLEKCKSQNGSLPDVSTISQEEHSSKIKRLVTFPIGSSSKTLPVTERIKNCNSTNYAVNNYTNQLYEKHFSDNTEGPSRFDIPEIEDMTLGVFSSFDDITYNTKPIIQASEEINENKIIKNVLSDTLSNKFTEIDDQNCLRDQCKRSICSDTNSWLESESTIELEDLKPSIKKCRYNNEKENQDKDEKSFNIKPIHSVSNHAKIIREVLKKYPHLVQHHKNIRLKIMQKESKNSEGLSSGKTKISYVVLTSDSLKTDLDNNEYLSENINEFHDDNSGNGFWRCTKCDLEEKYSSYSMYRMHMQGVHGYKFDPRICEYCGYKATKRNILMYHMYTKHNVPLPKNMSFPKCHVCSYIALSESLLIKHQTNHKHFSISHNLQNSFRDSKQYIQNQKDFINVTDLASVSSDFKNVIRDTGNNNYNTLRGENESQLNYQKNFQNYNCLFDIEPHFSSSDKKNVDDESIIYIGDFNKSMQCNPNKQELKMSLTKTELINDLEVENLQIKAINFAYSKNQNDMTTELFSNNLGNEKISVKDSKKNMLVNTHNDENLDISQSSVENSRCLNNRFSSEIVEKVKNTEIIKCNEQGMGCKLFETKDTVCVEQNSVNQNDCYLNLDERTTISNSKEMGIQYIEEETEILEYESCTT